MPKRIITLTTTSHSIDNSNFIPSKFKIAAKGSPYEEPAEWGYSKDQTLVDVCWNPASVKGALKIDLHDIGRGNTVKQQCFWRASLSTN